MVEQVGSEKAASILKEAIRKAAIEEGKHFREKADASLSTVDQFVELMELWKAGGPGSNAHGPNEFLHIPYGKKLTACVAAILRDFPG